MRSFLVQKHWKTSHIPYAYWNSGVPPRNSRNHPGIPGNPPRNYRAYPPPGIPGKKPGSWIKTRVEPRFSGGVPRKKPGLTRGLVLSMEHTSYMMYAHVYAYVCICMQKKNKKKTLSYPTWDDFLFFGKIRRIDFDFPWDLVNFSIFAGLFG